MNKPRPRYNFLPAFLIGMIEGLIVILSLLCFLIAKGIELLFLYGLVATGLVSSLLALGAYFTRKEELHHQSGDSKILKIYQALDIDEKLKQEMVADTQQENRAWEKKWQEGNNATSSLTARAYAFSMLGGFWSGGLVVMTNHYFFQLPDYSALFLPFVLLAFLGYCKYKLSAQNPINGMLLIALSGITAALAAYYAGSFF